MTSFALGAAPLRQGRVLVELRSVNHRYSEVRVRAALELSEHAAYVEQRARSLLGRGRHEIGLRVEGAALPAPELDRERLRATFRALCELRDELAPGSELPIAALTTLPGAFGLGAAESDREALRGALDRALDAAIAEHREVQQREGAALAEELAARLTDVRRLASALEAEAASQVTRQHARLRDRLDKLLATVELRLDEQRLAQELALLADRSDVTEELVRLGVHLGEFERCLGSAEPVGRRLDFLLQEIGREVNTVGAKVQDASLSLTVVSLKAETEKLREQVQNVE